MIDSPPGAQQLIELDQHRHALVMGSGPTTGISIPIWRIPLGDGPALALGRWDFPAGNGGIIRGSGRRKRGKCQRREGQQQSCKHRHGFPFLRRAQ